MGKTLTEKILSRTSGQKDVAAGDFVWAKPDIIWLGEGNFVREVDNLKRHGLDLNKASIGKVFETIDHDMPGSSQASVERKKRTREIGKFHGIHINDVGRHGIAHQLGSETGDIRPGMLVMASDVHTITLGGIGALSIAISRGLTYLLAAGESWLYVPETIQVSVRGKFAGWMTSRDVAQWLISQIGSERADYKVLEYTGPLVESLSIDGRLTLCNVSVEIGAKAAVVPADEVTENHFKTVVDKKNGTAWEPITSDPDAQYVERLSFDVSDLEPIVAMPPSPDNVHPIKEVVGTKINQAYIGSCAGGRMEDLRMAASILKGRSVAEGVRLLIVPTSQRIYSQAAREGLLEIFVDAGASVMMPGCSPCYGMQAPLSAGEICICTATRNDKGRMGSPDARIYLSGPAAVTASAIKGVVADPREFLP
jgi:3-isopropylmalate/(R)-2-methylmalate dehydratase large subunit